MNIDLAANESQRIFEIYLRVNDSYIELESDGICHSILAVEMVLFRRHPTPSPSVLWTHIAVKGLSPP